jgi:hypothetical protein
MADNFLQNSKSGERLQRHNETKAQLRCIIKGATEIRIDFADHVLLR